MGHAFVQAEFIGRLINRQKRRSSDLREALFRNLALRQKADDGTSIISETQAARALRRARQYLEGINQTGR